MPVEIIRGKHPALDDLVEESRYVDEERSNEQAGPAWTAFANSPQILVPPKHGCETQPVTATEPRPM